MIITASRTFKRQNIWNTEVPSNLVDVDTGGVNLGVQFESAVDGIIRGIRFYKGRTTSTGSQTGYLFNSGGTLLETTETTDFGTDTGWQELLFSSSIFLQASTKFTASMFWPIGRYPSTASVFTSDIVKDKLTAYQDGVSGNINGTYRYGTTGEYPNLTYNSSNYFTDLIFDYS